MTVSPHLSPLDQDLKTVDSGAAELVETDGYPSTHEANMRWYHWCSYERARLSCEKALAELRSEVESGKWKEEQVHTRREGAEAFRFSRGV